jgi:hypothetical protein
MDIIIEGTEVILIQGETEVARMTRDEARELAFRLRETFLILTFSEEVG